MKLKSILIPALVIGCLAYAWLGIARTQPQRDLVEPAQAQASSPYPSTVAATGLVEPSSESIAISGDLPGIVASVQVRPGQKVKRGEPLITLDTRPVEARRQVALASLQHAASEIDLARASTAQARRREQSSRRLLQSRAVATEEYDDRADDVTKAEAQLAGALAAAAQAQAELDAANLDLQRCTITAPLDATVLQVRVRVGEYLETTSSEPRLILGCIDPLHIRADVDEFDIPRLQPGLPATASPRGDATRRYTLEFVRIEPYVIPKKSLTGDPAERVDTRVAQIVYRLKEPGTLFVGQQVDLFLDAGKESR